MPKCPVCGRDPAICQDPDRAYDWSADAYRCHAMTALRQKQKRVNEEDDPHSDALFWVMRLNERTPPPA